MIREIRLEMVKIGFVLYARTVIVLCTNYYTLYWIKRKKKKRGINKNGFIKFSSSSYRMVRANYRHRRRDI